MSTHKHFDKICVAAVILSLALTLIFMNGEAIGLKSADRVMGYESRLFDSGKVHSIDIVMDDWEGFIAACENEEYAACALVIDGESYKNVGIRAKGNTSLSTVSSMDSDRYSFKVEFDQYDSTKSYYGLDKLSLNNLIQDATFMKDYLVYRMMGEFGAAAPLCSYVYITVNGEDWGLYLAVEGVEDAFLQRNYGSDYGELYKPDSMSMGGGRGNGMDFNMEDFRNSFEEGGFEMPSAPDMQNFVPSAIFGVDAAESFDRGGRGGGFDFGGMGSSDVKLQYIDDDPESYSAIFDSAKTDITDADKARLIQSLKALGSGDIKNSADIDALMRYFVVHNFVVNGDSYTGSMIHNYYLYEENGKLSMLPWDYNLAFGTFQGSSATASVNDPIDTPLSVSGNGDRPIIDWIFSSEEYTELYHRYFAEFLESVDIIGIIDAAAELIADYVEKDPGAFYSYEEFEKGVSALHEFCTLRTESVSAQLEGTLPSTDEGQAAEGVALVDASRLSLSDMGSMNMGGGMGGGGRFPGNGRGEMTIPDFSGIQKPGDTGMQTPQNPNMQTPDFSGMQMPGSAGVQMPENAGIQMSENTGASFREEFSGSMPGAAAEGGVQNIILLGASLLILAAGLLIAFKFKR